MEFEDAGYYLFARNNARQALFMTSANAAAVRVDWQRLVAPGKEACRLIMQRCGCLAGRYQSDTSADSPNQVHLQSGFLSRLAALDQVLARPAQTLLPDTLSNIAVPDEGEVKEETREPPEVKKRRAGQGDRPDGPVGMIAGDLAYHNQKHDGSAG